MDSLQLEENDESTNLDIDIIFSCVYNQYFREMANTKYTNVTICKDVPADIDTDFNFEEARDIFTKLGIDAEFLKRPHNPQMDTNDSDEVKDEDLLAQLGKDLKL